MVQLVAIDQHTIKKLRGVEPCLSRMTAETFASAGLDAVPHDLQARLLTICAGWLTGVRKPRLSLR